MNEPHHPITQLLSTFAEPEPPQALRERALAKARAAWERPALDPWRRAWESRPLRLAWAGAVLALAIANVAVRAAAHASRGAQAPFAAASGATRGNELQAVVALPRLRAEYVAIGTVPGNTLAPSAPEPARPLHGSEGKS
jgi:hypothetical protein